MTYKVEYLLIVEKGNTRSVESLRHLLHSDDELSLTNDHIQWNDHAFGYELTRGSVKSGAASTYFNLTVYCDEEGRMDDFVPLLRRVRTQLGLLQTTVFTLWDDVSRYYSARAYHQIHDIENLMRKLLTKFMLLNVGREWNKDHVPEDVSKSIHKANSDVEYFNNVDFIKLSDFLFSEHYPAKQRAVLEKLRTKDPTALRPDELEALFPRSNWSKYFADLVECEGDYLESRWKKLYNLRNAIAHNKQFTKRDAQEVERMTAEVGTHLEDALRKLEAVVVPEEERETVLEDVAGEQNRSVRSFIQRFRQLEYQLDVLYYQHQSEPLPPTFDFETAIERLEQKGTLDSDWAERLSTLGALRHELVHGEHRPRPRNDWRNYTRELEACREHLQTLVEYDEPYHTQVVKDDHIRQLYSTLKQRLLQLHPFGVRYNKYYISFVDDRNIVDVRLQQRAIKVWLNAPKGQLHDPQNLTKDVSHLGHLGNGDYEIRYTEAEQLEAILDLVRQTHAHQKQLRMSEEDQGA